MNFKSLLVKNFIDWGKNVFVENFLDHGKVFVFEQTFLVKSSENEV